MTICIASVCTHKGKPTFVISTDHMIDVGIGQFEHDIKKHKKIHGKNIAMLAGNALIFNELIAGIEEDIPFYGIRDKIYDNFTRIKKDWIDKQLLNKFGLEHAEIKEIVKGQIENQFIGKLIERIAKFQLKTIILLAGFDNGEAKIVEIREEGYADFSDIHFHAIGSGDVQAINTLLFQKQTIDTSLPITLYNVFKAKRNAEVCSGVGMDTDILLLMDTGCFEVSKEDITILDGVYHKELEVGKSSEDLNKLKVLNNLGKLENADL